MAQIDHSKRQINCKLVFYGPEGGGKTTSMQAIRTKAGKRYITGSHTQEGARDPRRLFEYLQLDLGRVDGYQTKLHVYGVLASDDSPLRRNVLRGADGVVFVADSDPRATITNLAARERLEQELRNHGETGIPLVLQWNKRDLADALPVATLNELLNPTGAPSFGTVARSGEGVLLALKAVTKLALDRVSSERRIELAAAVEIASRQHTVEHELEGAASAPSTGPIRRRLGGLVSIFRRRRIATSAA
ncbi:MAG: gliding-motility protein MglA [Planctomycetes bacterium]|nr:gliding-motility protein MglA [Planctomycetota bacterium]